MYPKTFDDLIYEFQKLPGVGAKTAERYAFTVLGWSDEEISELAETLVNLKKKVKKCTRCGNFVRTLIGIRISYAWCKIRKIYQ